MKIAILSIALGATLVSGVAAAADPAEVTEAKKRFAEGKSLFAEHKYEEARLKYVQACAVLRTDNCLRGLAIAELKADKPADAYRHFKELFDNPKAIAGIDAAGLRDLQAMRDEAYAKSAHLAIEAPGGLAITVDGVESGLTPMKDTIDVMPGAHQVAVRGDANRVLSVTSPAGQVVKVRFDDQPPAAPAGAPQMPVPATTMTPPPPGMPSTAPTDGAAQRSVERPSEMPKTVTILVLGGAAVVAAGVGVYFLTQAGSADDDVTRLKAQNPDCGRKTSQGCADLASAADTRTTDRNLATISFIGTGAFIAGAVATYFLWPSPSRSHAATGAFVVHPSVSPQGGGVNIAGRF